MQDQQSVLETKRGRQILLLLLAVALLDFVDASIVNVALPRSAPISGSRCRTCSGCSAATS